MSLDSVYESEKYENLVIELIDDLTEMFQSDDGVTNIFQKDTFESVIINFYKVFQDDEISIEIVEGFVKKTLSIGVIISMEAKRSLLKLVTSRPTIKDGFELGKFLLDPLFGLDTKETLLAIQFGVIYSVPNKQKVIDNLIRLNLDPLKLDTKIKQFLKKIIGEQIESESQRR